MPLREDEKREVEEIARRIVKEEIKSVLSGKPKPSQKKTESSTGQKGRAKK